MSNSYVNESIGGGLGGLGGMGGGPIWLLLGLFLSRGGLGGFGCGNGGAPAEAAAFSTTMDAISAGRSETLSAITSSRSEGLAALQGIVAGQTEARVEGMSQLAGLLTAISNSSSSVKETLTGALSTIATENRALLGQVLSGQGKSELQACKDTSAIMGDINAATQVTTAQYNCTTRALDALSCGQQKLMMEVGQVEKNIIAFITLSQERCANAALQAEVCALKTANERAYVDQKFLRLEDWIKSIISGLPLAPTATPTADAIASALMSKMGAMGMVK